MNWALIVLIVVVAICFCVCLLVDSWARPQTILSSCIVVLLFSLFFLITPAYSVEYSITPKNVSSNRNYLHVVVDNSQTLTFNTTEIVNAYNDGGELSVFKIVKKNAYGMDYSIEYRASVKPLEENSR